VRDTGKRPDSGSCSGYLGARFNTSPCFRVQLLKLLLLLIFLRRIVDLGSLPNLTDEPVDPRHTSKAPDKGAAGGEAFGFPDYSCGEMPMLASQLAKQIQKLVIGTAFGSIGRVTRRSALGIVANQRICGQNAAKAPLVRGRRRNAFGLVDDLA